MNSPRRPSRQTTALLDALGAQPSVWRYGYDLVGELAIKSGSLYPILIRLADRGWLETRWETNGPQGRPPRHLYRLSPGGLEYAHAVRRAESPSTPRPRLLEA